MSAITLFIAPGSCSRVPLISLHEIGVNFDPRVVRFMAGEHKSPDYLRINPKGKVPALIVEGEALTENVAIQLFLAGRYPGAGLLPPTTSPLDQARQVADLSFCSATLHPLVTRIRMPQMIGPAAASRAIHDQASAAIRDPFALIEERLTHGGWWYGDRWSAMDSYLHWVFWRVTGAGFDATDFPRYADHNARVMARPATQRALATEAAATAQLEAEGLLFVPPPLA